LRKRVIIAVVMVLLLAGGAAWLRRDPAPAAVWTYETTDHLMDICISPAGEIALIQVDRIDVLDGQGEPLWQAENPLPTGMINPEWIFTETGLYGQDQQGQLCRVAAKSSVQPRPSGLQQAVKFALRQPGVPENRTPATKLAQELVWLCGTGAQGIELQGYNSAGKPDRKIPFRSVPQGYNWTLGDNVVYGIDDSHYDLIGSNWNGSGQSVDLLAVNLDGSLRWRKPFWQLTRCSIPVVMPGDNVLLSGALELLVLDATGKQLQPAREELVYGCAVSPQGRTYACTDSGLLELAPDGAVVNAYEHEEICGVRITPTGDVCAWTRPSEEKPKRLYIFDAGLQLKQQRRIDYGTHLAGLPNGNIVLTDGFSKVECIAP
jgi:hypothetical protein